MVVLLLSALAAPDARLVDVVLGEGHACARTSESGVACWGRNDRGQLGHGDGPDDETPRQVGDLFDVITLVAGDQHTCALRRDRTVWCWGDASEGQVGPSRLPWTAKPQRVEIGPVKALAAGAFHTCAVTMDGATSCWGSNLVGQLGVEGLAGSPFPVPVRGLGKAVAIAAGYGHTCAAVPAEPGGAAQDAVWCWGDGTDGRVGRADALSPGPHPPLPIDAAFDGLRGLHARQHHTCAVDKGGVTCWGPPLPGAAPSLSPGAGLPTRVLEASDVMLVSVGWQHACALASTGRLTCWGDPTQTGHRRPLPLVVGAFGLNDAVSVAAGQQRTCAARREGPLACWGNPTLEERRLAELERPEVPRGPTVRKVRAYPPGTALLVEADEVLRPDGARVRFTVRTLEDNPCANAQLFHEPTRKRNTIRMALGDVFLPGGDCVNSPGPATATFEMEPGETGRFDLAVRWRKKEDYYQVFVKHDTLEIIDLQSTFSTWDGERKLWRVPTGGMAISCTDYLDSPLCVRRAAAGLPTCATLRDDPVVTAAPTLSDRVWATDAFGADPKALRIAPDEGLETWPARVERSWFDGSGCVVVDVVNWQGGVWRNQP